MTTFNDLMSLAGRTLRAGYPDLAGQISVLALETFDDQLITDDIGDEMQREADEDQLGEKPLIDALEEGADSAGYSGFDGQKGEAPMAMVLEMAALAKRLRDEGHIEQARQINQSIEALSSTLPAPTFGVRVVSNVIRISGSARKRWALLCAKLVSDKRLDVAADVVGTLMLRRVQASEVKQFDLMSGDAPILEELHDMLDELGYDSLMKMGEKRRKELENGPPGIHIPFQQGTM